jgi:ubiquitin
MNLILGGNSNMGVGAPAGGQPHAAGHGGSRQQPGAIQVTQEEMDAINRLVSLGFPKHKAAEAYFACDKNEELAANFLFESGGEDEETLMQRTLAESAAQAQASTQQQQPAAQANPNPNPSGSGSGADQQ